ncbi:DNA oxidative demethylase AlkB [Rosenbergiella sp. S61]|uniref:DNA oxidative demethylase AlkB n=1 Tax=Rosenbergiella gaditana TaxID=2726987 RepID=A0ABS5SV80_9GAMM|nr:DNA oxidative demethylase AlkB [Rosenbergiella gaditana]MBT0724029.1 DNA oxidative demethylase AlkB [Rosenbergiella gaditana]
MFDFFQDEEPWQEPLASGAVVLRRFVQGDDHDLYQEVNNIAAQNPFIHRITPGGFRMSVAMTGRGAAQWLSGRDGYLSNSESLPLSDTLLAFAKRAAIEAGYPDFIPDSCLINRYAVDSKMTLHQDKNERDLRQPIVSVSLGLPAVFLFGGLLRSDKTSKVLLEHGDVVVWGGESRLCFHGISPLKPGIHPLTGPYRFNITFRKAL